MLAVRAHWAAANTPGGLSTFYFGGDHDAHYYRESVAFLMNAIKYYLQSTTSVVIDPIVQTITPATGAITAEETDSEAMSVTGTHTDGKVVPNASQALLQWRTGVYRAGRQVRGRTFVPGISDDLVTAGELPSATVSAFQTAQSDFLDSAGDFGVWSRPVAADPDHDQVARAGAFTPVSGGTTWSELAVLRSRR